MKEKLIILILTAIMALTACSNSANVETFYIGAISYSVPENAESIDTESSQSSLIYKQYTFPSKSEELSATLCIATGTIEAGEEMHSSLEAFYDSDDDFWSVILADENNEADPPVPTVTKTNISEINGIPLEKGVKWYFEVTSGESLKRKEIAISAFTETDYFYFEYFASEEDFDESVFNVFISSVKLI